VHLVEEPGSIGLLSVQLPASPYREANTCAPISLDPCAAVIAFSETEFLAAGNPNGIAQDKVVIYISKPLIAKGVVESELPL
ncbi:hypothetical protein H4R33_006163, partial [Dimargaris cristalligena]